LVKHDCDQWLVEVDASLPTVVISARDRDGRDIGDVRVLVDGAPFLEKLDGKAVSIDAGEHKIHFERAGESPLDQQIIVREGEKNRQVAVRFGPAMDKSPPAKPPPVEPVPPSQPEVKRGPPVLALTLIGVGVVALGVSGYFEYQQIINYNALRDGCAQRHNCLSSDIDTVASERLYAGIALGVGVVAAGVGAVLLLTRGPPDKHAAADALPAPPKDAWLEVVPLRGGGVAALRGSF
jgi:hypothetical protein